MARAPHLSYACGCLRVGQGSSFGWQCALEVVEVEAHHAGARQVPEAVQQADEEDLDHDQGEAALQLREA